ncbi:hypothetical protein Trydic_g14133 [Trypoxylus dichotomus]
MFGFGTRIPMIMLYLLTICHECISYRRMDFSKLNPKIVGGTDAKIDDFPFMVRLEIAVKPPKRVGCGGSYIKPLWVLTAAHCLDINDDNSKLKPSTGDVHDRVKLIMEIDDLKRKDYQSMLSEKLCIHPDYFRNNTFVDNDVGLIKIPVPFNVTKKAQLVSMPSKEIDYSGQSVTIIGWGVMNDTDEAGNVALPSKLQKLKTTVMDMKNCSELTENEKVICIGKKGEVSCSGDSGGPLIYQEIVIGICSFGFGCSGDYAVYGNVYPYLGWIEKNIESGAKSLLFLPPLAGPIIERLWDTSVVVELRGTQQLRKDTSIAELAFVTSMKIRKSDDPAGLQLTCLFLSEKGRTPEFGKFPPPGERYHSRLTNVLHPFGYHSLKPPPDHDNNIIGVAQRDDCPVWEWKAPWPLPQLLGKWPTPKVLLVGYTELETADQGPVVAVSGRSYGPTNFKDLNKFPCKVPVYSRCSRVRLDKDIGTLSPNKEGAARTLTFHGEFDYSRKIVTIFGWGATTDTGGADNIAQPTRLQMLKTTVLDMKNCSEWTKSRKVICIGKKGEIACSGDSGGPLVYQKIVIGVCSFGFGCSREYAIYVYSYWKWIEKVTGVGAESLHCGGTLILLLTILKTNL